MMRYVFGALALFLSACGFSTDQDDPPPRIVWGEHIEGVRIGDDSATVVRKLGRPTVIRGDDFEGGIFIYAEDTKYNLMWVAISKDAALGLGVIYLHVYEPYNGTTKDGVGIRTSRREALRFLRSPDTTYSPFNDVLIDGYFSQTNAFWIEYRNEIAHLISMTQPLRYR
jgi:hypothetical protein